MHRSFSHLIAVASSVLAACVAPGADAQTPASLFPELATVVASDGQAAEGLGWAVAVSGDTLVVGAPFDAGGSVRVFVRSGSAWVLQATLTASDGVSSDQFGTTVSISGDSIAVGVPFDDVGTNVDQGSVRIFARSGSAWAAQATLLASDGAAGDAFGHSVSLSGETLAVGAYRDDVGTNTNQGSVRVFVRSGGTWSHQATLVASDGAAVDEFGNSVSLAGETLAVGVRGDDVGANTNQGSVRVFVRSGSTWSQQAMVMAPDASPFDQFGDSVSLSGETLAVGVPFDDVAAIADQGSVRIFVGSGTSWSSQATVTASDGKAGDDFGRAIAVDGDTLVVGSMTDDVGTQENRGSATVFVRSGGAWTGRAMLTAGDGEAEDYFGASVSVSGDTLAIGARLDSVGANSQQGSVRVFGSHRVYNETRNSYWSSLNDAIAAGVAGDRLVVGAAAFAQANDIVDAQQTRYTFVAVEPIAIPQNVLMRVATNTVFERSPDVAAGGLTVEGKLIAPASGTLAFQQLTVANEGQFMQRESTVVVNEGLVTAGGGACYMQGPMLAETVSTLVGGQHRIAGDTDVFADYNNAGSTIVQRGILYIYGTLVNTGTITGEVDNGYLPPAAGDGYAIGGDYAVSADSSIVLPDPVWWLRVGGSLDMAIDSASRFVMDQATLEMSGVGDEPSQSLEVFARDLGAVDSGFATTNFLLGALRVRSGANVSLVDSHNNAPGKTAEAIYTNELFVPAGATLVTNGYRIYTRAATIAGTVSNPADIVVVPGVPPCPEDIFPDGVVNAGDLGALLASWGPCTGSCTADLDGNGSVGATDLAQLLAAWGLCGAD